MDKDEATNEESLSVHPTIKEFLKVEQPAQEPIYIIGEGWQCDKLPKEGTKLYTHPAPAKDGIELEWYCKGWDDAIRDKEWVGLSDEEIGRLTVFEGLHHVEVPLLAKFIIAIEQALKIKNT